MQRAAVKHDQRVCLTLEFLWSVFPATSFIAQYFKDQGLTQSQIFGLQVVITSVMVLTDIPLGYIADKFSLRCIVITGMIIQVVQSVYFLWCQSFWQFEISYVMSGLYLSALSNTTSTIMTQSVSRITDVTARAQAYSEYEKHRIGIRSYAFFVGAIVGSVLVAAGTTTWPFLVQPFVYTIGLVVGLSTLKLPRHFVAAKRRTRISIRAALRRTLKNRPDIRYVILLTAIVQMEGFACLWLFQPRTQHTGMPVWLFGAVYIIRSVAILVLQRTNLMKRISPRIMWPCLLVSMPVGAFTAALTTGYAGLAVLIMAHAFESAFADVMMLTYLFRVLPDGAETRTTELSVASTIATMSRLMIGPMVGWMNDTYSLSAAFIFIAVVGVGLGAPTLWAFRRSACH